MSRVRRGFKARRRRNKILKAASGFRSARSTLYRSAAESVHRAWAFAYRDRKAKKRDFRRLWIVRINAAARDNGVSYSVLVADLRRANIALDRKVLADIALHDPKAFTRIVQTAR